MGRKKETTNTTEKANKKEKIYNVRIVEDSTKKSLSKKEFLATIILSLSFYVFFNLKELMESIFINYNFWDVFTETFKQLIYSSALSVVIFFVTYVSPLANKKNM